MNPDPKIHQTQIAAFLHDPIEKALILMRTKEGHEKGTSQVLRQQLGLDPLPEDIAEAVKYADHWASAADRAVFPKTDESGGRFTVHFTEQPEIIHPLTGEKHTLEKLREVGAEAVKAIARDHLEGLIQRNGGDIDHHRTALAFWRFGPEERESQLANLWAQLPADSRVPDHTLIDHLDLTTALAVCFQQDPERGPAHLVVTLGPVQPFIAAARSTSDLWAGSHLLSHIAWEAMRVICERLGPQSILFPRLRGVPLVDLWLRDEMGLDPALFEHEPWTRGASDANPLFIAALPNRFTALVPAGQAEEIAAEITDRVRTWVREEAEASYRLLLETAGIEPRDDLPGFAQIREQLAGFPEVHWVAVPWSLVETNEKKRLTPNGAEPLRRAMAPFFHSEPPGYLGSPVWRIMEKVLAGENANFWPPNPGTLYPAYFELAERSLAAVKSIRPFPALRQEGWRDSLTGELEWLTTDRAQLQAPPGERENENTLWTRIAAEKPAWAKPGEHLAAPGTLKRLWPTRFVAKLKAGVDQRFSRFVVSTHTMAIAGSLLAAIEANRPLPEPLKEALEDHLGERVPLPRKLARAIQNHPDEAYLRAIPVWLEALNEREDDDEAPALRQAEKLLRDFLGHAPEKYYALMLMDGDKMGAWLSADPQVAERRYRESFHTSIRAQIENQEDAQLQEYAHSPRAASPAWHMAISEALNHFALRLAPQVVEEHCAGRVLYAGGDDLMAMLPVRHLLPAMVGARAAYSGVDPQEIGIELDLKYQRQDNGFVLHKDRLLRLMGDKATASCGAVVAHHKAPLGAVLRELRQAEKRAKSEGGRNAFAITIIKRSGGALRFSAKWGTPMVVLNRLVAFLADSRVSRRAVYHSLGWLRDLPEPCDAADREMLARTLAYQFRRQCASKATADHLHVDGLAADVVTVTCDQAPEGGRRAWLENVLTVAEFLAREGRRDPSAHTQPTPTKEAQAS